MAAELLTSEDFRKYLEQTNPNKLIEICLDADSIGYAFDSAQRRIDYLIRAYENEVEIEREISELFRIFADRGLYMELRALSTRGHPAIEKALKFWM